MFDTGILNGKIYLEGSWIEGNLYIRNQVIDTLSQSYLPCKEEYDAKGNSVLPGLIDSHVHLALSVGKYTSKDDFYDGSKAAALGGITTYIDFLDPIKTVSQLQDAFQQRRNLAKKSVIDYGFHGTVAQPQDPPNQVIAVMQSLGIPTVKLFTTYSSSQRRTYDDYIDGLLQVSKELKTRILIHAENEEMFSKEPSIAVKNHENARPPLSEISEVLKLAEMARYRDGLLYIVHTNCGTTVERVKSLYSDMIHRSLILESCPHYFLFNSSVHQAEKGYLYTMTPPLRSEEERKKLCSHLDGIDVIATDHCPFTDHEKQHPIVQQIPMGIGGVSCCFSSMYHKFGDEVLDKFTIGPAKIHGLYPKKGTLMPGADADVIIVDTNQQWTVSETQKEEGTPYGGITMKGKVLCTISKGKFVVKDGVFLGGQGQYIGRELTEY